MALVFPLPLSCWGRGSPGRKRGTAPCACPWHLHSTGQSQAWLGAVLVCSFSLSELLCHLGQEGWVGGKGLFSPVCPEEASALAVLGMGSSWHSGWLPWLSWAFCALPAAPVGNKSHGNCQKRSKKAVGRAGGSQSQLALSRWHRAWWQCPEEPQQSLLCLSCARFGANSPGNRPGKFAHPRPAQRELHQHLVPGQGAGGAAGEAHTLLGGQGCQGSSLLCQGDLCSEPSLCSGTAGARQKQMEQAQKWHCDPLALSWCQV